MNTKPRPVCYLAKFGIVQRVTPKMEAAADTYCGKKASERRWARDWKRVTCRDCKGIRQRKWDEGAPQRAADLGRALSLFANAMSGADRREFAATVESYEIPMDTEGIPS